MQTHTKHHNHSNNIPNKQHNTIHTHSTTTTNMCLFANKHIYTNENKHTTNTNKTNYNNTGQTHTYANNTQTQPTNILTEQTNPKT